MLSPQSGDNCHSHGKQVASLGMPGSGHQVVEIIIPGITDELSGISDFSLDL